MKHRLEAVAPLVIGLATFVVYVAGACRTIYVGDSGELVAAVHLMGIPHPSGYPLYVMLGKLWTLLVPAGSIAFRMSLFSAFFAAASNGLLYVVCRRLGLSRFVALVGSLLFAFSPSLWSQANIQRVYTLNAFFVILATLLALRWFEREQRVDLALVFLACGIGASNHTFLVVFAMALAITVVIMQPRVVWAWRTIILSVVVFAAGLSPYLFLPIRSRMDPKLDWGNPESWTNFRRVVTREDFWNRSWVESPGDLVRVLLDWGESLFRETAWIGPALAAVTLVSLAMTMRRSAWLIRGSDVPRAREPEDSRTRFAIALLALVVMVGNVLSMALHGSRPDIFIWHRYYIPSYLMLCLLGAMGLEVIARRVPRKLVTLAMLAPAFLLMSGWGSFDRSKYRVGEDFSRQLLESLPPGSTLIASDDNILFVLIYLHHVEGLRPDVNLILQGVAEGTPPRFSFNPDEDPVFLTHHPNWSVPQLEIVPQGLVFRAWRSGTPWPPVRISSLRLDGEDDPAIPRDYLTQNLIGHFHYMLGVTFELADWPRADEQFAIAARSSPFNDVLFYNLGLIYARNGLFDRALGFFERADAIDSRGIASAGSAHGTERRSRASDRMAELKGEAARLRSLESRLAEESSLRVEEADPSYHLAMARLLLLDGESVAARGHEIRAMMLRVGEPITSETRSPSPRPGRF